MLNRRGFLKRAAAGLAAMAAPRVLRGAETAGAAGAGGAAGSAKGLNLLFIMTDQQHAGMMSCTGNADLKTPALDALAASGVRFERAYATNPVCVPSRLSLQTGRMPSLVGMRLNETPVKVPPELCRSLGPVLRRAGYETAYGGKLHVPGGLARSMRKDGYDFIEANQRQKLAETCAKFLRRRGRGAAGSGSAGGGRPFFLFASFLNPHDICYMAINAYQRARGRGPVGNVDSRTCEGLLDEARRGGDLAKFVRDHCPPLPPNFAVPPGEPECITTDYLQVRPFRQYVRQNWTGDDWRLHRWAYARLTEKVDRQIGLVLAALNDARLAERTLVVFTSDHGDHDAAHRLEHKSILYENAARVPLILSLPGRVARGRADDSHLVSNGLDLLPTLCDYAAAGTPPGLPGRSLRPLAEANSDKAAEAAAAAAGWRDHVVVESQNGRMVRTERYKYCVYERGDNRETLVDLKTDPGEMANLAGSAGLSGELNRHRHLLARWADQQHDAIGQSFLVRPGA